MVTRRLKGTNKLPLFTWQDDKKAMESRLAKAQEQAETMAKQKAAQEQAVKGRASEYLREFVNGLESLRIAKSMGFSDPERSTFLREASATVFHTLIMLPDGPVKKHFLKVKELFENNEFIRIKAQLGLRMHNSDVILTKKALTALIGNTRNPRTKMELMGLFNWYSELIG